MVYSMKVLVTGATGFIGKHLVESLLQNNYEVLCVTRKPIEKGTFSKAIENVTVDMQEIEKMEKYMEGIDIVIHVAAQLGHYGIPYQYYYDVNYQASVKLARMSVKSGVKQFILCSAPFVTGLEGRYTGEDAPYAPTNEYSETKMLAEQGVIQECTGHIPYTILRPSYVYGVGDTRRTALYRGIQKRIFVLTTNGKSHLQPTYVTDIVDGFLLCILNKAAYNEIFNLGAERDYTSKEYLECIARNVGTHLIQINIGYPLSVFFADIIDFVWKKLFNKSGFVNRGRIDFLARDHSCDISKAKKILGYHPKVSLEDGIKMTIDWSRKNGYVK